VHVACNQTAHDGIEDGVGIAAVGLTGAVIDIRVLVDVVRVRIGSMQPTWGVLNAKLEDDAESGRTKSIELSLDDGDIGRVGRALVWIKILPAYADDFKSDAGGAFFGEVRPVVFEQAPKMRLCGR